MRGAYGFASPNTCCQRIQPFHMSGRQEEFTLLSPEHLGIFFRPWTALVNGRARKSKEIRKGPGAELYGGWGRWDLKAVSVESERTTNTENCKEPANISFTFGYSWGPSVLPQWPQCQTKLP